MHAETCYAFAMHFNVLFLMSLAIGGMVVAMRLRGLTASLSLTGV